MNRCKEPACEQTRFLFVRHGETDWNIEKRIQGHTDIPLNLRGREQATLVADYIARHESDVAAIHSSDLQRAQATAQAIAKKFALDIAVDARLREVYMGQAQGLLTSEYEERFGSIRKNLDKAHTDIVTRWNYSEVIDGEPRNMLLKRLYERMKEIACVNKNKTVVLVTHAGVIRTLLLSSVAHDNALFQKFYSQPLVNCGIVEFAYQDVTCTFTRIHEV